MDDITVVLAIHLVAVVLWIGGVAMVTTVLLPAVRQFKTPEERITFFELVERRFARQARVTNLVTGASGLYMVYRLNLWPMFASVAYWWLDAMVLIWLIFTVMLFMAEPLFLNRWLEAHARHAPESTFALVQRLHWILLSLSLVTIAGAVAGAHGVSFG